MPVQQGSAGDSATAGARARRQVLSLAEVAWNDAAEVGGKAASCARLLRAGFPVPDGVAIIAAGAGNSAALAEVKAALQHWPEDALFAVRSSASDEDTPEHSFAGMHETRLNVSRAEIPEAVRACWASMHSAQAIAYRQARGRSEDGIGAGVLVQLMVAAQVAGVAFTRHPVTGADEIVINAAPGSGEAVVSGRVQPQQWRVGRDGQQSAPEGRGGKSLVLPDEKVEELAALARRVDRLFGAPQDIEWCHDGRQFWIVQARPITVIATAAPELEWTRANVREVLPDLPAPQVTDEVCDLLDRGERGYGGRMWAPAAELGPIAKAFCGRPYFNLSQLRYAMRMFGRAPAELLRAVGYSGSIAPEDEQVEPLKWGRFLRAGPDFLRVAYYQLFIGSVVRRYVRRMARGVEEGWPPNIDHLSDEAVARGFDVRDEMARLLRPIFALAGVLEYETAVRKLLARRGIGYDEVARPYLAAGAKSVTAQQGLDLLRMSATARRDAEVSRYFRESETFEDYRERLAGSEFLREFEEFLKRYGHRGTCESDWSLPRYAEDPSPLLQAVQAHVRAPSCLSAEEMERVQAAEARMAWERFEARLSRWDRRTLAPLVRRLLERIKRMYGWRELYRSELMRQGGKRRRWHLAIGQRFVDRGWIASRDDYFMLTFDEISGALRGSGSERLREIAVLRQAELAVWREMEMPLLLRDSEVRNLMAPVPLTAAPGVRLHGLCISPGQAEGEVVVLRRPDDFAHMKPGAVLVAPATDPAWTPLFTLAAGLIVEIGGLLSHAAIVAREYGLPALANVADATRLLHDGDRVRLDASGGVVEIRAAAEATQRK